MHPAHALSFARISQDYARWRAVPEQRRSDAPGWWWGPALALRDVDKPMPAEVAAPFAQQGATTYADAATLILGAFADQIFQPWPENFPEKFRAKADDPAPSAEPAAQAEAIAVTPIA